MTIYRKKNFVIARVPTFINGFNITSHICGYDNILSKFDFKVLDSRSRLTTEIFSNV